LPAGCNFLGNSLKVLAPPADEANGNECPVGDSAEHGRPIPPHKLLTREYAKYQHFFEKFLKSAAIRADAEVSVRVRLVASH